MKLVQILKELSFSLFGNVQNSLAPMAFRFANDVPFDLPVFTLVLSRILEKHTSMFIKDRMCPFGKSKEAHGKHWEGREARVGKGNLARLRVISSSARKDSIANFGDHRGKIFRQELIRGDR